MIVLDTDHINALQQCSSAAGDLLAERQLTAGQEVATTIVSFEEHMRNGPFVTDLRRRNGPSLTITVTSRSFSSACGS